MEIKQVTYIHNKNNKTSRDLLNQVPPSVDIVDVYDQGKPLPGTYTGLEWVRSGGTIKWRGVPAVVIIIPAYHVPETTEGDVVVPAHNVEQEQYVFEIQESWQAVEDFVSLVNERAQLHPPQ